MATFGKIGARPMLTQHFTAKDYIQDGLVAMWDGIENVDWDAHDGNATTWVDLVGGKNFALTQYGEFDSDSFVSNSIYQQSAATVNAIFTGVKSMQFCKWTTEAYTDAQGGWMFEAQINSTTMGFGIHTKYNSASPNTPVGSIIIRGSSYQQNNPLFLSANEVSPYPKNTVTAIIDGTSVIAGYIGNENASVLIGQNNTGANLARLGAERWGRWWRGHIYSIRLYNHTLSQSEVMYNNAIDKKRFNI